MSRQPRGSNGQCAPEESRGWVLAKGLNQGLVTSRASAEERGLGYFGTVVP